MELARGLGQVVVVSDSLPVVLAEALDAKKLPLAMDGHAAVQGPLAQEVLSSDTQLYPASGDEQQPEDAQAPCNTRIGSGAAVPDPVQKRLPAQRYDSIFSVCCNLLASRSNTAGTY